MFQKKYPDSIKKRHLDFLDILLTAKDEQNNGLTFQEIRDEVDTFLFEGTCTLWDNWITACVFYYVIKAIITYLRTPFQQGKHLQTSCPVNLYCKAIIERK